MTTHFNGWSWMSACDHAWPCMTGDVPSMLMEVDNLGVVRLTDAVMRGVPPPSTAPRQERPPELEALGAFRVWRHFVPIWSPNILEEVLLIRHILDFAEYYSGVSGISEMFDIWFENSGLFFSAVLDSSPCFSTQSVAVFGRKAWKICESSSCGGSGKHNMHATRPNIDGTRRSAVHATSFEGSLQAFSGKTSFTKANLLPANNQCVGRLELQEALAVVEECADASVHVTTVQPQRSAFNPVKKYPSIGYFGWPLD
ncbi:hypothetical protein C8F04DRAFT_1184018 [Mycena alexandri]|uniref:Uncharacterized protein n=1 Tax=Mycena alexandri TaxID=1745969 RepID=A0AAD6X3K0_9AGAR|nr:hypothetical protein C8F04DRAFT_1184018 [Mycena alexandri]